jgi:thiaminase/transcriptional activator TenA
MAGEPNSFFEQLTFSTAHLHQMVLDHPMIRGIGSGTLPDETFRFYIEQDYQFLLRYVRCIAYGAAVSPDLATMERLTTLLASTLTTEIEALRRLYQSFSGKPGQLDQVRAAPTCQAYTDHLLGTAARGNVLVILSAILPCQWGYGQIGRSLMSAGLPTDSRYSAWIEEYASDAYHDLVDWLIDCFNQSAADAPKRDLNECCELFQLSSRYELAFWQMAWTREAWTP